MLAVAMDPLQPLAPARASPRRPLVLQVSPLPGSNKSEEFFYDPFTDVVAGNFAAAWLFFIKNMLSVVTHDCPNTPTFQALFPGAMIQFFLLSPPLFSLGVKPSLQLFVRSFLLPPLLLAVL
jgi:hypothetical protein